MGQWAVYYTSHQSLLMRWLNNFGDFVNFDWLAHQVQC